MWFTLNDYFKGSLLSYYYAVYDKETGQEIDELDVLINFRENFNLISQAVIGKNDFTKQLDPFPRSTILVKDLQLDLSVYFIDRSLNLNLYDANKVSMGDTSSVYSAPKPIDTTIVNQSCTDLSYVYTVENDYLIMFCLS